jgi:hypothetical protein
LRTYSERAERARRNVDAHDMKIVFALVRGALCGALVLVLGVFLYRSYILYASGASLTAVPLPEMLLDVMALHHYAAIGAGVGAAVSALVRCGRWGRTAAGIWRRNGRRIPSITARSTPRSSRSTRPRPSVISPNATGTNADTRGSPAPAVSTR